MTNKLSSLPQSITVVGNNIRYDVVSIPGRLQVLQLNSQHARKATNHANSKDDLQTLTNPEHERPLRR